MMMVFTINCCLPSILFSHSTGSHHISSNGQDCHSNERENLDVIPNLNQLGNDELAKQNLFKFKIALNTSKDCYDPPNANNEISKSYITYKLWGYNSSLSSGVFRL